MSGHLVHGMGTELEPPVWPAVTVAEAGAIVARFAGAGAVLEVPWHSPRPFSAAARVCTTMGEFVLKRHHHRVRSCDVLAQEHAFMAHLRRADFDVPEVMTTAHGLGAIADGEWVYELHRRAPGIDLYGERQSWTPFLASGHAYEAGIALARLHIAARGFTQGSRGAHPLIASFTILPSHDPIEAARTFVEARPALAAYLQRRNWREALSRLLAALGDGLSPRLAVQPRLWTHNDWHPSNLLWSSEGTVSTVFDFGLAAPGCALHDLAIAIERTAIPWLELGKRGPRRAEGDAVPVDDALALLAGYQAVLPLTAFDRETLLRLLPLVHIEFALSEVDYFTGVLGDEVQASMAWEGYLIDHAEWFLEPAGRDFLARLEEGMRA